jgi:hypothetical protein
MKCEMQIHMKAKCGTDYKASYRFESCPDFAEIQHNDGGAV